MAQEPMKPGIPRNTVGLYPMTVAPGGLELLRTPASSADMRLSIYSEMLLDAFAADTTRAFI